MSGSARIILSANMLGIEGRIQREGEVVHLVAHQLTDLSAMLAGIGNHEAAFPLPHGRGDEFAHGGPGHDPRDAAPKPHKVRDIYVPDLHIDTLKLKPRNFH